MIQIIFLIRFCHLRIYVCEVACLSLSFLFFNSVDSFVNKPYMYLSCMSEIDPQHPDIVTVRFTLAGDVWELKSVIFHYLDMT